MHRVGVCAPCVCTVCVCVCVCVLHHGCIPQMLCVPHPAARPGVHTHVCVCVCVCVHPAALLHWFVVRGGPRVSL